jgi:hypothetical protein
VWSRSDEQLFFISSLKNNYDDLPHSEGESQMLNEFLRFCKTDPGWNETDRVAGLRSLQDVSDQTWFYEGLTYQLIGAVLQLMEPEETRPAPTHFYLVGRVSNELK